MLTSRYVLGRGDAVRYRRAGLAVMGSQQSGEIKSHVWSCVSSQQEVGSDVRYYGKQAWGTPEL